VNKNIQFRARILAHPKPGEVKIGLWPHPDREPYWAALPKDYLIDMLISELMPTPSPTAKITGYFEELVNAGLGAGNEWKDLQGNINTSPVQAAPVAPAAPPAHPSPLTGHTGPAAPPMASDGFQDSKVSRPAHVPFGGTPLGTTTVPLVHTPGISVTMGTSPPPAASKAQALANQMQTAVAAETANQVPPPNFEPKVGDVVEFLPAPTHRFFSKFEGKHAVVTDVSLGDGQLMVSVLIEGVEYPDLQSGRFKLHSRPAPVKQPADSATHERMRQASSSLAASSTASGGTVAPLGHPVPQQTVPGVSLLPPTLEAAQALVGKSVVFQAKGHAPFNAPLTAVTDAGPTLLGYTHPWESVERLSLLTPTDIPGAKAPKLTPAQKKEAKVREEADALFADRANALAKAAQLATAMSTGEGKVTKKGVEALVPLLTQALAYQEEQAHAIASSTPAPGASAPAATYDHTQTLKYLEVAASHVGEAMRRLGAG
jgi:hypothetical protein